MPIFFIGLVVLVALETLVGGLVVAALGGLTYVAYKHPEGYARIDKGISWVLRVVAIGSSGWFIGFFCGAASVLDHARDNEGSVAGYRVFDFPWLYFALWIGFVLYSIFLTFLPDILGTRAGVDTKPSSRAPKEPSDP